MVLLRMLLVAAWSSFVPGNLRAENAGSNSAANPALREELLRRVKEDQEIANEYYPKEAAGKLDATLIARRQASLSNNTARIKEIIKEYGWPGPDLVGRDGSDAAFLLVQHSDNAFRKQMLPAVRRAYKSHKLSGQDYALLLDIVRVADGKPQVYGTRMKPFDQWRDHQPVPEPIEDEANLDKRRAEVGLLPFSLYLETMKEMRFPTQGQPSQMEQIRHMPGGDLMLGAIEFLASLKGQNKLPGVSNDEHGTFPFTERKPSPKITTPCQPIITPLSKQHPAAAGAWSRRGAGTAADESWSAFLFRRNSRRHPPFGTNRETRTLKPASRSNHFRSWPPTASARTNLLSFSSAPNPERKIVLPGPKQHPPGRAAGEVLKIVSRENSGGARG